MNRKDEGGRGFRLRRRYSGACMVGEACLAGETPVLSAAFSLRIRSSSREKNASTA